MSTHAISKTQLTLVGKRKSDDSGIGDDNGSRKSTPHYQQLSNAKKRARKDGDGKTSNYNKNNRRTSSDKPARLSKKDERRDLLKQAKETWERLRPRANDEREAGKLAGEIHGLVKGRLDEFVFRHDGSRIVQWIFGCGNADIKEAIVDELMNDSEKNVPQKISNENGEGVVKETLFSRLLADRYARHIVVKVMKRSSPKNRTRIFNTHILPHVSSLMRQMYGINILDVACSTLLNAQCRAKVILAILFAKSTTHLELLSSEENNGDGNDDSNINKNNKSNNNSAGATTDKNKNTNIAGTPAGQLFHQAVLKVSEEFRGVVREKAYETVSSFLEKENVLSSQIIHSVVYEWLMDAIEVKDVDRVVAIASSLAPNLVHFVHTRPGLSVAVTCIKVLDAKHRKKVVRSFKGYLRKLVVDRCSHRAVLTLLRWMDDTRTFGRLFATELCTTETVTPELSMDIDTKGTEETDEFVPPKTATKSRGGLSRAQQKSIKKKKKSEEQKEEGKSRNDGETLDDNDGNIEGNENEQKVEVEEEENVDGDDWIPVKTEQDNKDEGRKGKSNLAQSNLKPQKAQKEDKPKENIGEGETEEEDGIDITWMLLMCNHKFGRTLFLYLLFGIDTRYFNPDSYQMVWDPLDSSTFKETSKKDEDVRRKELFGWVSKGLCTVVRRRAESLLLNPLGGAIMVGAAMHSELTDALIDGIVSTLKSKEDANTICSSKVGRRVLAAIFKVGGVDVAKRIIGGLDPDVVKHITTISDCEFFTVSQVLKKK